MAFWAAVITCGVQGGLDASDSGKDAGEGLGGGGGEGLVSLRPSIFLPHQVSPDLLETARPQQRAR